MATFSEKVKLLKGLMTGERAYVGPFYVCVDITRRCNLKCPACRFHSWGSELPGKDKTDGLDMPVGLFERICRELKAVGTTTVTITGQGEPLLHPDLPKLIRHARAAGLRVTMTTNGTLLDESIVGTIIDLQLDHLKVSLWAGTPEEYVKIYPGTNPGYFNNITGGLELLSIFKKKKGSVRPFVVLHHPCTTNNYDRLDDIIEVAQATGCDGISFSPVRLWRDDMEPLALSPEQETSVCRSLAQARRKLDAVSMSHNIDEMLLRYKIGIKVWEKLPCYVSWLYARITVDAKVFSCHNCSIPMGDLTKDTLCEIWNGRPYRTFRRTALTREGLASLGDICNCDYCGQTEENVRVHRVFKWFSPLLRKQGGKTKYDLRANGKGNTP